MEKNRGTDLRSDDRPRIEVTFGQRQICDPSSSMFSLLIALFGDFRKPFWPHVSQEKLSTGRIYNGFRVM